MFNLQQDHLQFNAKIVLKFSFGYTSKKTDASYTLALDFRK